MSRESAIKGKTASVSAGKTTRKRIRGMFLIFAILMVIPVVARLFTLQIIQHTEYESKAISQQTRDSAITPTRGTIFDRNLKELAVSASVETVYIAPKSIKNEAQAQLIAKGLSEILGVPEEEVLEKTKKKNYYQEIKKKVELETAEKVRAFKVENKLGAINLVPDTKRYYLYGTFASAVIGFVGTDNYGLQGVEAYYDNDLQGLPGKIVTAKNAGGTEMPFAYEQLEDAQNGLNLVLTIDEVIQLYAEKYLKQAVLEANAAKGGAALVINCKTGEILALSNYPDYNLNSPFDILDTAVQTAMDTAPTPEEKSKARSDYLNYLWRNKVVSDTYEPGSTFKTITASIGLEEGVIGTNATFNCPGYYKVGGRMVKCWKSGGHGHEDFVDGLSNSCNVVFMQLGLSMGPEIFYNYNTAFGFREKTGIDLPGEGTGIMHSRATLENPISLATASFGQTFRVTPLQELTAIAAIANGGNIVRPHVAKEFVDDDKVTIKKFDAAVKRQVISAETAAIVRSMMEEVVSRGTGKNAYIQGYRVAGKTATSEKTDQRNEQGKVDKYISSFIGFAPADNPEVAVLVMIDEPNTYTNSGGLLCAPAVKNILAETLPYLGIAPQYTPEELANLEIAVPNVVGMTAEEAKNKLSEAGFFYRTSGSGSTVTEQVPGVNVRLKKGTTIVLYLGEKDSATIEVPSVIGLSSDAARAKLETAGLTLKITGNTGKGYAAAKQTPLAGGMVPPGTVVTVEFLANTAGDEGIVSSDNLVD